MSVSFNICHPYAGLVYWFRLEMAVYRSEYAKQRCTLLQTAILSQQVVLPSDPRTGVDRSPTETTNAMPGLQLQTKVIVTTAS